MKVLVFDIWGDYAHFKKIYATTSALSYLVPTKPTVYGYIGAIIGLEKFGNDYLNRFGNKSCQIGISLLGSASMEQGFVNNDAPEYPVLLRRMGINLKSELGRRKETASPKPTLMEFIYRPKYRLYVHHSDPAIFELLKIHLQEHRTVYTPTLGLAGLISNFQFIGEFSAEAQEVKTAVPIHTIIPKKQFLGFDNSMFDDPEHEFYIVEQSMFAIEMDTERNVTERDDILLERTGKPVLAKVKKHYSINNANVVLF
jgi:CRISPR-associated protein Cas5h